MKLKIMFKLEFKFKINMKLRLELKQIKIKIDVKLSGLMLKNLIRKKIIEFIYFFPNYFYQKI